MNLHSKKNAIIKVARHIGETAYHNAMGGSMNPWYGVNIGTAAKIIEMIYDDADYQTVFDDLHKLSYEYYKAEFKSNDA